MSGSLQSQTKKSAPGEVWKRLDTITCKGLHPHLKLDNWYKTLCDVNAGGDGDKLTDAKHVEFSCDCVTREYAEALMERWQSELSKHDSFYALMYLSHVTHTNMLCEIRPAYWSSVRNMICASE